MIVDFLFGDIVEEMTFILFGCESAFVSNFIVSFAFRKVYAGEVLQYAQQESFELFIVWQGAVAVCETTQFQEPVVLYERGTVFNLYQLMMDTTLPFDYRAVWPDEYRKRWHDVEFRELHQVRKNRIAFNDHKFKPFEFPSTSKDVQLYSVEKERLEELFEMYPKAEQIFEDYCVKQTKHLREVRLRAEHFYNPEVKEHDFTCNGKRVPLYLNRKERRDDLDFEVMCMKEATQEERLHELVLQVNRKMAVLMKSMKQV